MNIKKRGDKYYAKFSIFDGSILQIENDMYLFNTGNCKLLATTNVSESDNVEKLGFGSLNEMYAIPLLKPSVAGKKFPTTIQLELVITVFNAYANYHLKSDNGVIEY